MNPDRLAFDRASVRTYDVDGRLHVAVSPITKANICAYYGSEIPNSQALGLEPGRRYYLLRHPEELEKAASSFNNLPILDKHVYVKASNPQKKNIVGTTGSEAAFDGKYLKNSLTIWDDSAIAGIETEIQDEISSSYHYRADMTPGVFENEKYDGVMRDIIGNHVALVETGRAGSDVVVFDSQPLELKMSKRKEAAIRSALKPVLAQDADIDAAVRKAMLALDEAEKEDKADKKAEDEESEAAKKKAEDEETEEEKAEREAKEKAAEDEEEDDKKKDDEDKKTAMDAAIRKAGSDAEAKAVARFNAIRRAEADVKPLIGDVVAMDSADDIYKFALDSLNIAHKGVHPSAFPALIEMAKTQKAAPKNPVIALDSAAADDFSKRFPSAGKLVRS
ncbi:DUF2213 domain-containing protein [Yersinia enterocolitica]|uniref:DUF2213 domain-containing protein n=1 Tax=Yersinia enterocolitica TaxID=630 RepID=UPI0021E71949|nr:DUF2213 domain-containing protein [Yersinia enterocolitica]UYJ75329.1 DUF2213 domain-containing protein [Yersinia enterocolitica]HDL8066227.1 DUF2213 domain-containing protein [Yersinia enterocolitica]